MATTYVESSALVKRYVAEVGSAWVRRTVARPVHQVLYTAALTEVEVRGMFQRCWSAILSGCMRCRATPKPTE